MFAGLEPPLLSLAASVDLDEQRLLLLQLVLRAIDEDSPVTHETATSTAVLATVPRALIVLSANAAGGQPYPPVVKDVCAGALLAVRAARRARGRPRQALTAAERALTAIVALSNNRATFPGYAANPSASLKGSMEALRQMVRDDLCAYWDRCRSILPDAVYVAREAAVLLVDARRHEDGVRRSIDRFLRRTDRSAAQLLLAFFPDPTRYRVACAVDGADRLRHLRDLRGDARQFSFDDDKPSGWGTANDGLANFLREMGAARPGGPHRRPGCAVSIEVDAVDAETAGAVGHRQISELLDHYVAGHRLVDLRLRTDVVVAEISRSTTQWRSTAPRSVPEAYPLSQAWPAALGEAMRMAHIARSTDSPLAAAALSWSSIESAGLDPKPLAGALALQTLRHQLIHTHAEVFSGALAAQKARAATAAALLHRAGGLQHSFDNFQGPADARASLKSRLDDAVAQADAALEERDRHAAVVADCTARIRGHVDFRERGYVQDLNTWVDLLRPTRNRDNVVVNVARQALNELLIEIPPASADLAGRWQRRLSRPSSAAQWLTDTAATFFAELRWLYATRNLTIHTGQIALPGDAETAQAASGLADLALEFLGSWYSTATRQGDPAAHSPPARIVDDLQRRSVDVAAHLKARHALTRFHAEHLTSPTSTGWDRPRATS